MFKRGILMMTVVLVTAITLNQSCNKEVPSVESPDNIILLIGDGMGVSHVYAGLTANGGSLSLEEFTHTGFQKTYSASNYITDSGASGTAMATGQKTRNGVIGVDTAGKPVRNICEYAMDAGLATGIVATSTITHATPAAFAAHNPNRNNYEEIALDFTNSGPDLFIGGGRAHFLHREDGRNLFPELEAKGYHITGTLDDLSPDPQLPLAVLTDSLHMPPAHMGRGDILSRALRLSLDLLSEDPDGFFLMLESSQIDWAGHNNDTGYLVAEMLDFNKVIEIALEFAKEEGGTLLIVTADHETGGFALNDGDFSTGRVVGGFTTDDHTGVMVPVFAFGPGAPEFSGIYENTAIFDKMMALLELD